MKGFSSIFRRERRPKTGPDRARKRPARTLALWFGSLEGRALLTTMGTSTFNSTAGAVVAALSTPPPPPNLSFTAPAPFGKSGGADGAGRAWPQVSQTNPIGEAGG